MTRTADIIVVGAGILGAAVADALTKKYAHLKVVIVERMQQPAMHQTGRNSGVIHAGVYYPPNSLKAQYCKEGNARTIALCKQYSIPYEQCGKLLVATHANELERMEQLFERCKDNGLNPIPLTKAQINAIEPNITTEGGFKVSQSGITDYAMVCNALLQSAKETGRCDAIYGYGVSSISESSDSVCVIAKAINGEHSINIKGGKLINCAGIYADEIARLAGLEPNIRMLPFRGEYFRLSSKFDGITDHLIYPIPDPQMPFLGVHLTKMVDGFTTVGPNAVLASGKEAYKGMSWKPKEWAKILGYQGTWLLLSQFPKSVLNELYTSLSRQAYVRKIQAYCPDVQADDLLPFRAGIRAQAVTPKGELVHDFLFSETNNTLHVLNAPSPAATSAMPIADAIIEKLIHSTNIAVL